MLKELRLSDAQGDRVLEELASQGYISLGPPQHKEFEYQITELAYELVPSSAAKRISRTTTQDALKGLISRAKEITLSIRCRLRMATFSSGVKWLRSFLIRSLRCLNGRALFSISS